MEASQLLSTSLRASVRAVLWASAGLCSAAYADVVTTVDGARLTGTIEKVTPKEIELKTAYAGKLTVTMDQVASFETEKEMTTQLTDSTTVTGVTQLDEQKNVRVVGTTSSSVARLGQLQASWVAGTPPPPESLFDTRHWTYLLGADLTGKSGNSDERNTNINGAMALVSKRDELRFYGSYETAEQDDDQTSDQSIGGASYTAFVTVPWGWYVRGELEKDKFEDIDLRTTLAAGGTWRPILTEERTLRFWLGLGYRNESYTTDVEDDSSATLDSGVAHSWTMKPWLSLVNSLSYSPQLEHFGNYLLAHDSAFVMPIGASQWTVRLGVHNDYNSYPAPDSDKLDTTWYTRVLLRFE